MTIYPLLSSVIFLLLYSLSPFLSSVNLLNSSKQVAMMCLYILLFLVSARFQIKKKVIFICITLLCLASGGLYIMYLFTPAFVPFLKPDSLQFIIPTAGGHNHLGDLLGLGLVALSVSMGPIQFNFVAVLFYVILMFISFSKSAFLSVLVTLFSLAVIKRGKYLFFLFCMVGIATLSVMVYTRELSSLPLVARLQTYMSKYIHLEPKTFLSARDLYVTQVSQSWVTASLEHSFFGFGPGNFIYASNKTALNSGMAVTDTHNIILTIIMESGLLTAFWFLIFFMFIIFIGKKTDNPLIYLIIYLFANFQTDYTYRIAAFFALFFFLSGQIVAPLINKGGRSFLYVLIGVIATFTIFFCGYSYYQNQEYQRLNLLLTESFSAKNITAFNQASRKLEKMTPYDDFLLSNLATYNEILKNTKESVRLLEKIALYHPRKYLSLLPHQLDLQQREGVNIKTYLEGRKRDFAQFPFTERENRQLNKICKSYAKIRCVR